MNATSLIAVLVYIHVCVAATDCEKFDAKLDASLEEIKGMLNEFIQSCCGNGGNNGSNGNNQHCDQISRIYDISTIGLPDAAINIFDGPWYIHISDKGSVYLIDLLGRKLYKVDSQNLSTYKSVNFDGTPVGIYATSTQVLVADATNKRIVEYTTDLDLVKTIINMPVVPNGVAVDCDNNYEIYVTGRTTGIVYVYNSDGIKSHEIKIAEPGDYLRKICFVNDLMYISSLGEGSVYVYTKAGAFVNRYRPRGLTWADGPFVDGNGNIYVPDAIYDKCNVYVLNSSGEVIKVFSCEPGKSPRDVSIAPDGKLWVSAFWGSNYNAALYIYF